MSNLKLSKDVTLPPKSEILKAMQMVEKAGSQIATYLRKRAESIVENSKFLNKNPEYRKIADQIITTLTELETRTKYQDSSANVWRGETPRSRAENMQIGLEIAAQQEIQDKNITRIKFDYAISESGEFIRGYLVENDETPLEQSTKDSLDVYFGNWLLDKHRTITDYEGHFLKIPDDMALPDITSMTEKQKEILFSKLKKLKTEEIEKLMDTKEDSFKTYLVEKGIEVESNQRDYPDENRVSERVQRVAEQALEMAITEIDKLAESLKAGPVEETTEKATKSI